MVFPVLKLPGLTHDIDEAAIVFRESREKFQYLSALLACEDRFVRHLHGLVVPYGARLIV